MQQKEKRQGTEPGTKQKDRKQRDRNKKQKKLWAGTHIIWRALS
jgi:hypothetical protein